MGGVRGSAVILTAGLTLKCYICNSADSCKKPKLHECTTQLAHDTRDHWIQYRSGVYLNKTTADYACFREFTKMSSSAVYYRGCAYTFVNGCDLAVNPSAGQDLKARECIQCKDRDGCNPAGRISIDMMSVYATVIIAGLLRYVWN